MIVIVIVIVIAVVMVVREVGERVTRVGQHVPAAMLVLGMQMMQPGAAVEPVPGTAHPGRHRPVRQQCHNCARTAAT